MAMTDEPEQPMSMRSKVIVALIGSILFLSLLYWGYSFWRDKPIREIQNMISDMTLEKMLDAKMEDKIAGMKRIGELREKMSDNQKEQTDKMFQAHMQKQAEVKFNRFFSLNQDDQKKELDKDIDRMFSMMKDGMQNFKGFGGMGGKGGASTSKSGDGKGTNFTMRMGGNGGKNSSPEQRNRSASDRLDGSSPEMRAQMTEYFRRLQDRLKERGVQSIPFLGGFGGPKPK